MWKVGDFSDNWAYNVNLGKSPQRSAEPSGKKLY